MLEWMGLNFYYFDGLQSKMRAGIINEHECKARIGADYGNDNRMMCEHLLPYSFWIFFLRLRKQPKNSNRLHLPLYL